MRSLLLTRRWLGFTLLAVVVVATCVRLGFWQLDRGQARSAYNTELGERGRAEPVAATDLLDPGVGPPADAQWRRISAAGRYETPDTLLVRNRTQDGNLGYDVLVPLRDATGTLLLVNRGWVPLGAPDRDVVVPAPPPGEVTVVGRLRLAGGGDLGYDPDRQPSVTRIDPLAIGSSILDESVYGGFVEATEESPAPATALVRRGEPESQNAGLNYAYFFQWEVFAIIGVVGWYLLLRRETLDARDADARAGEGDVPPAQDPTEERAWQA